MGTRSYAQVAPTADTMAMNAYIFGYGGHSLVTPHAALKQVWWTEERIKAKVTRAFVISKLVGKERDFIDRPLAFGEGLTNDTYIEWLFTRARRLFLVLAEIGVPDQIFGCIDDSWCDDDLPISLGTIPRLELASENDETLNKKFYDAQFLYLLRELRQGHHIDYGPNEHVPMEYVNTLPPAVTLQVWDRVHLSNAPEAVYMRRKYSLNDKDHGRKYRNGFTSDVQKAQQLEHEHIVPVWASYTSGESAFIVSDYVAEHTLGSFIDHRMPAQYQKLQAPKRPALLCEWMHCLADALAFIHTRGEAHTAIKPSNILIDRTNRIAFADVGSLRTFQRGKRHNRVEAYDYATPESDLASTSSLDLGSARSRTCGRSRKSSSIGQSSSSGSSGSVSTRDSMISNIPPFPQVLTASERLDDMSTRANSIFPMPNAPIIPTSNERPDSVSTISGLGSPFWSSPSSTLNFSRHLGSHNAAPTAVSSAQIADVFSLGCIFLDIVSFMVKGRNTDFAKFRTTRVSLAPDSKRTRDDTSFHRTPEKINAWTVLLRDHSERRPERTFKGVPELLQLIREMMSQHPVLRPSALDVRDRLRRILTGSCGMHVLCCADRNG